MRIQEREKDGGKEMKRAFVRNLANRNDTRVSVCVGVHVFVLRVD